MSTKAVQGAPDRGAISSRSGGAATRERILLESSRLFARWGYHSTATRSIARKVGIQQPSLFHHFESKQAIMEELLALNFGRAVEFATAMSQAAGSPAARLYCVLRADLEHVASVPYDLSGTQGDDVITDPAFKKWRACQKKLHGAWRSLVEDGIASREFFPYDTRLVQLTIEGVFKELIRAAARHSPDDDVPSSDELARYMLRSLLLNPNHIDQVVANAHRIEEIAEYRY